MTNLNDTLPELMRRATENLEPESADLVERGMRRGATLRRRRTALVSLSGATAVLATTGIIVGSSQLFSGAAPDEAPAASAATSASSPPPAPTRQISKSASPATTLATLLKVLPADLKQSAPQSGTVNGVFRASVVLDDGKGASLIEVLVMNAKPNVLSCAGLHGTCTVSKDGTTTSSYANELVFPYEPSKNPGGVRQTVVDIIRPDGTTIAIYSYNALKNIATSHTRPKPLFSVAELTKLANSPQWVYPPDVNNGKTASPGIGTGKPTVPVAQTLQTLKKVLPTDLQFTRPETWGGGDNGFNGAAYVVNDGKGLSRVDVLVARDRPITKCGEGLSHCKVRPDGSLTSWSKDEPVYADARQTQLGVLGTRAEIRYKDGRYIVMTSYNAVDEKGSKHTRVKPALTAEQLLTMAGNKEWKFPGPKK